MNANAVAWDCCSALKGPGRFVIALLLFFVLIACAEATVLYVAPNGNDAANGSIHAPLRSLAGARDRIRELNRAKFSGATVFFRGGLYPVSTQILFESVDSGRRDAKIIYKSFPGESPVLDGCSYLTNWELYDPRRNIYRSRVQGEVFRQLYIDDSLAVRARFPVPVPGDEYGPLLPVDVKPPYLYVDESYLKRLDVGGVSPGVEAVLFSHWYQQYLKVRFEGWRNGVGAFFVLDSSDKFNKSVLFYKGSFVRFENSLSLVSSPTDWYLDQEAGYLYLKMANEVSVVGHKVGYPKIDSLVVIRGTPESPVEDIEFQGLTFQCSNWSYPSRRGLNFTQLAQPVNASRTFDSQSYPPGLVKVEHARRIALRNSVVRNSGGTGVQLFQDVDDSDFEGNRIFDVAGNGFEIDVPIVPRPSPNQQSSGVSMWNNELYRCGRSYSNGGGVLVNNVTSFVFEHNDVRDMPYSCIQLCSHPLPGGGSVGCEGNRIRFNRFNGCMMLHDDGGAIYTLGGQSVGSVISENYVSNLKRGRWAGVFPVESVYLDNHTNGLLVYGNVLSGGRVAELNGSFGNHILNNDLTDQSVVEQSGVLKGFVPIR